jgi:hypothetical protein
MYVNGSFLISQLLNVAHIPTGLVQTGIGAYLSSTNVVNPAKATLADVAIWNVDLTAFEISALAKGARPNIIRPASLVAWWPLDGLQSPEPDLSRNAKNGTLTGTAAAFGPPYAPFTPRWPQIILPPVSLFTLMPQIVT